jgi:hypothetical protein
LVDRDHEAFSVDVEQDRFKPAGSANQNKERAKRATRGNVP